MHEVKCEISEKEYDDYMKMTPGEMSKKVEENIPDYWRWGYGWYGCKTLAEDGKYYMIHTIGDSCD